MVAERQMKRNGKSRLPVFAVAVALAAAYFAFRSATAESVYPIEKAVRFFRRGVVARVAGAFRGAEARAENARLKRQVMALAVLVDDVERLEKEHVRLRKLPDCRARLPGRWIAAGVLSRGGGAVDTGGMLRIDKGSLSGVRKDAVVVVPEGLVGKVSSVTAHTAEVILVIDPRLNVSCVFEKPGAKAYGILSGGTEDRIAVKYMTPGAETAGAGSRVLTSGLGGVFPPGFVVGDYTGDGAVASRVDFSSLEDVLVLE